MSAVAEPFPAAASAVPCRPSVQGGDAADEGLPRDVEAALVAPLYSRVTSLVLGHLVGLFLCAVATARVGGMWPAALTAASLLVLGARVWVLLRAPRLGRTSCPDKLLRWRVPYQAVGIVWAAVNGLLCGYSVAAGDDITRLVAVILAFGVTGTIASRNAGTPRYAMAQVAAWLVPVAAASSTMGSWYLVLTGFAAMQVGVLSSVVRQHFRETLSLLDAQRTLAMREARLRSFFENAAAGFLEAEAATGRIIGVNRVFCDMVGWSEAELLGGMHLSDLTPPEDQAAATERQDAISRTGEAYALERRYLRRDGTGFWARISVSIGAVDDAGQPSRAVVIVQDITERKAAEAELRASQARLRHLAQHDTLTELPNRALLRIRLNEAIARARRGESFAVCCLDLDRFKQVNDTLGHPVGDALLQAVAARLRAELRPADTVARLGGDEFAVVLSGIERSADAELLAERLIASLTAPYVIDGRHLVAVGTSVGIAVAPGDGLDPDLLLRNADKALLQAKAEGRGRYRMFEAELDRTPPGRDLHPAGMHALGGPPGEHRGLRPAQDHALIGAEAGGIALGAAPVQPSREQELAA